MPGSSIHWNLLGPTVASRTQQQRHLCHMPQLMRQLVLAVALLVMPACSQLLTAAQPARFEQGRLPQQDTPSSSLSSWATWDKLLVAMGNTTAASAAGAAGGPLAAATAANRRLLQSSSPSPPAAANTTATGGGLDIPYRIIGGVQALKDRFRYICSVNDASTNFHYCGCSLIASNVALTAAHCVAQTQASMRNPIIEVGRYYLTGETPGVDYDRLQCTSLVHPQWDFTTATNDIALCFLAAPSQFAPIQLAADRMTLPANTDFTVMGWGSTAEGGSNTDVLMVTQVQQINRSTCNAAYENRVTNNQICAGLPGGGADACQGDSGGPLIVQGATSATDVQVGVVSYGAGCGRAGYPGVYTDVRAYRTWIAQSLQARNITYGPVTAGYTSSAASGAPPTSPPPARVPTPARPVAAPSPSRPNRPTGVTTVVNFGGTSTGSTGSSGSTSSTSSGGASSSTDPCACTMTGVSGSTFVQSLGCAQHGARYGDTSFYCYVMGGTKCQGATASANFPGAAWRPCQSTASAAVRLPTGALATAAGDLDANSTAQLKSASTVQAGPVGLSVAAVEGDALESYKGALSQASVNALSSFNSWLGGLWRQKP